MIVGQWSAGNLPLLQSRYRSLRPMRSCRDSHGFCCGCGPSIGKTAPTRGNLDCSDFMSINLFPDKSAHCLVIDYWWQFYVCDPSWAGMLCLWATQGLPAVECS